MRNSDLGLAKCGVRMGECQVGWAWQRQLGPEMLEEAGEDALGHAPDDGFLDLVGGEFAALAADVEMD